MTVTGTANINTSSTAATNVGTASGSGIVSIDNNAANVNAVNIGGGLNNVVIGAGTGVKKLVIGACDISASSSTTCADANVKATSVVVITGQGYTGTSRCWVAQLTAGASFRVEQQHCGYNGQLHDRESVTNNA